MELREKLIEAISEEKTVSYCPRWEYKCNGECSNCSGSSSIYQKQEQGLKDYSVDEMADAALSVFGPLQAENAGLHRELDLQIKTVATFQDLMKAGTRREEALQKENASLRKQLAEADGKWISLSDLLPQQGVEIDLFVESWGLIPNVTKTEDQELIFVDQNGDVVFEVDWYWSQKAIHWMLRPPAPGKEADNA